MRRRSRGESSMALSRSRTMGSSVLGLFDSENLPQTLVSEIRQFLRVANQIEAEAPRVAYTCNVMSSCHSIMVLGLPVRRHCKYEVHYTFLFCKLMDLLSYMPLLDREMLRHACGIAQVVDVSEDIEKRPDYNILPLDPEGAQQAIMQLPEVGLNDEVIIEFSSHIT
ncbi:Callose synthase 1 [Acorus calamus]|uniref:Callose synthase 1 n=1 Tax=Acorus calamus TaxID=4465 RepID=A0AAV9DNZ2_ACOCL|nr:Callose synthase 1 [Acorus calamus]